MLRMRLEHFKDLRCLSEICSEPVRKSVSVRPSASSFATSLSEVYATTEEPCSNGDLSMLSSFEHFTINELNEAFQRMSKGKCAAKHGVVLEMFAQGGPCLHNMLLEIFNKILHTGDFSEDWSELFFVMLPKGGDPLDPGNWRAIAILDITYKMFAKLLSI